MSENLNMPEAEEDPNLKAGHPPAVKAGGMRVVQHKRHASGDKPEEKPSQEDIEEFGTSPPKPDKHHQQMIVSGAVTKGDRDFPPEAVKVMHEKPVPKHENRAPHTHGSQCQHPLHQPRK